MTALELAAAALEQAATAGDEQWQKRWKRTITEQNPHTVALIPCRNMQRKKGKEKKHTIYVENLKKR
uniref:Uncharacterized protein n=1 Tax=Nymphaea colorata TaxID=210225 RepID=A0A5K0WN00_9MAGN